MRSLVHGRRPASSLLALLGFVVVVWLVAGILFVADRARTDPFEADPEADTFSNIREYVRSEADASRLPGVAIAVVESDGTIRTDAFGTDAEAIGPETPFWIGSNTKSFTALAVMQLVEAGLVELDMPVRTYLPEFTTTEPADSARITVRMLLNHTSGFSRASGIEPLLEERQQTLEEAVADLREVELNRPVGETFEYSNLNFVLLGFLIERSSGVEWSAYIEERIFGPLDMGESFARLEPAKENGLTPVHRFWFGFPVETEGLYLEALAPTGWLFSSTSDMARYLSMYLQGGTLDGARLLSEQGIATMLAPNTNETSRPLQSHEFTFRYAQGWFAGEFGAADDARWHLGNLPYFTAWMVLLPETEQAVVALINSGSQFEFAGANEVFSRIPIGIVNILVGEEPPSGTGIREFFILFNALALTTVSVQVWSLFRVAVGRTGSGLLGKPLRLIPLLWEVGISVLVLVAFPMLLQANWPQTFQQIPDLTIVLLVVSALWLLTAAVRLVRPFVPRLGRG